MSPFTSSCTSISEVYGLSLGSAEGCKEVSSMEGWGESLAAHLLAAHLRDTQAPESHMSVPRNRAIGCWTQGKGPRGA